MPTDRAIFGGDAVQHFLCQFLHQLGLVGITGVALRKQVWRDGPAFGLIGFASDEQECAVGGRDLLGGEHPADGMGLAVRRLADLDLLVVIVGEGKRARRVER